MFEDSKNNSLKPSDLTGSFPLGSSFGDGRAEFVAKEIVQILFRTGNTWRLLTWEEYKREREREKNFNEFGEHRQFDRVVDHFISPSGVKEFGGEWIPMFQHLRKKRVILVTGPQRSGTRFIAKAIAHDTGHRYVDEAEIHTDSVYEVFWVIQQHEESLVIQCPGLCHLAPALVKAHDVIIDEFFLVMCMRNIKDILVSQKRIDWGWEWLERLKYTNQPFLLYLNQHKPVVHIKYEAWKHDKQSLSPKKYLEVQYEDMKDHPLWIPKEQRKDWGFSQTEIMEEK